jgi:hypothetical protein
MSKISKREFLGKVKSNSMNFKVNNKTNKKKEFNKKKCRKSFNYGE